MSEDPIRPRDPIADDVALVALDTGEMDILGRMPWSSNGTFLVDLVAGDVELQAIYKPTRGERPLWDFPPGLHRRERAAYVLSRQLGWDLVPPTVIRDGPLGVGSVQLVIPCDYREHYFTMLEDTALHAPLQQLCIFDIVANSTDRKAGHCLRSADHRIYAIDNGLSFHEEFKLRTVIWDWGGEPVPAAITEDLLAVMDDGFDDELADLLTADEMDALAERTHSVIRSGRFPVDHTGHRHPWPLV